MGSQLILFYNNVNKFFDIIFHPIQTLQNISYSVCLVMVGVIIIFGIIGLKNCFKYAAVFVVIYILLNII